MPDLKHTNSNGIEIVKNVESEDIMSFKRQEETPFGTQTLLYIKGKGAIWVDGSIEDVKKSLEKP